MMSFYPDLSMYYAAAAANPFSAAAAARLQAATSPPMKRARMIVPPVTSPVTSPRTVIAKSPQAPPARKPEGTVSLDDLKIYCTADILICGNCREMFRSIAELLHHKKDYCKLRFACKCSHEALQLTKPEELSAVLFCGLCSESFNRAMDLIDHFQSTHSVNIYMVENGEDEESDGDSQGPVDRDFQNRLISAGQNASGNTPRVNGQNMIGDLTTRAETLHPS